MEYTNCSTLHHDRSHSRFKDILADDSAKTSLTNRLPRMLVRYDAGKGIKVHQKRAEANMAARIEVVVKEPLVFSQRYYLDLYQSFGRREQQG